MKKFIVFGGIILLYALLVSQANATLISVSGPLSSQDVAAQIIAPPADVTNFNTTNLAMQGFDEQQGVSLLADIQVDGGAISAGTLVDSHMIFLNPMMTVNHFDVYWEFSGTILGVMSDEYGTKEVQSSPLLGSLGTLYPAATFDGRGIEVGSLDNYIPTGNILMVSMDASPSGDWIRVITAAETEPIPEPTTMLLLGTGLVGVAGAARRKKKKNQA